MTLHDDLRALVERMGEYPAQTYYYDEGYADASERWQGELSAILERHPETDYKQEITK